MHTATALTGKTFGDSLDAFEDGAVLGMRTADGKTQWLPKLVILFTAVVNARRGQVIFALSNPDAEIDPDVAVAAGAAYAGDGRSINNALAFPGILRGALDVRAKSITPEMRLAAAEAIAAHAEPGDLVPNPLDLRVNAAVRQAVADMARSQGLANTARLA